MGEGDWYEEWVSGSLENTTTVDEIMAYPFHTPECIVEPDNYDEKVMSLKKSGMFVSGGIPNPYKQAWLLRGMENVLADYLITHEILDALYDRLYSLYTEIAIRIANAGVDMITITGGYCYAG